MVHEIKKAIGLKQYDLAMKMIEESLASSAEDIAKIESLRLEIIIRKGEIEEASRYVENLKNKYPESIAIFANQQARILIKQGRNEDAVQLIDDALKGNIDAESRMYLNNLRVSIVNSIEQKDELKVRELLQLDEAEFMEKIKGLTNDQKIFLLVARYKKNNQDKIAQCAVKEYARKHIGLDANIHLLRGFAQEKAKVIDTDKWQRYFNKIKVEELDRKEHAK